MTKTLVHHKDTKLVLVHQSDTKLSSYDFLLTSELSP